MTEPTIPATHTTHRNCAGFLFIFNEGRTPEGTIPGKATFAPDKCWHFLCPWGSESVGSSREQRPSAMHKGKMPAGRVPTVGASGDAGAVTEERLPRRNGGRIANYVTGVAQFPPLFYEIIC